MKIEFAFTKSITWKYFIVFLGFLISMIITKDIYKWRWLIYGIIIGIPVEVTSIVLRHKKRKICNSVEAAILYTCAFIGICSLFFHFLTGLVVGILFSVIIIQIAYQLLTRKILNIDRVHKIEEEIIHTDQ